MSEREDGALWSGLREVLTYPLVAWLIRDRSVGLAMLGAGVVIGGMNLAGVRVWVCPFRAMTSLDCPGCGLTRGAGEIFKGNLAGSLGYHWFAPFFVMGAVVLGMGIVLPAGVRDRYADWVDSLERKTGVSGGVLVISVIYGLTRNFWQ